MTSLRRYRNEYYAVMGVHINIVGVGPSYNYVIMDQYMYWYKTVSKLRIAPFVGGDPKKIVPRDWYS